MVQSTAPEGTSFELMNDYLADIINVVDTMPERQAFISVTAPGFGTASPPTTASCALRSCSPKSAPRHRMNWRRT
jgi:hypothetical protein